MRQIHATRKGVARASATALAFIVAQVFAVVRTSAVALFALATLFILTSEEAGAQQQGALDADGGATIEGGTAIESGTAINGVDRTDGSAAINETNGATTIRVARDWKRGEIIFTLQEALAPYARRGASGAAAYNANRKWQSRFDVIIPYVLDAVSFDSAETVLSQARTRRIEHEVVALAARHAILTYSGLNTEYSSVEARYRLPLYPTVVSFFPETPRPIERHYEWVASRDYSGIVIIATGALPLYNSATVRVAATPTLSPIIYDEQLRVVASAAMVDPAFRELYGAVAYDSAYGAEEWRDRVGVAPFVMYARAVDDAAGKNIVIATADAAQILFRDANRRLIREGRILLILNTINIESHLTIDY